jgi:hypothetical protein
MIDLKKNLNFKYKRKLKIPKKVLPFLIYETAISQIHCPTSPQHSLYTIYVILIYANSKSSVQ